LPQKSSVLLTNQPRTGKIKSMLSVRGGREAFMPRKKNNTRRGNLEGSIYQRKDGKWSG